MARPSRKTLRLNGTRLPSRDSTPSANAMSVAIGMPQPSLPAPPALNDRKIAAGATMPPSAAIVHRPSGQKQKEPALAGSSVRRYSVEGILAGLSVTPAGAIIEAMANFCAECGGPLEMREAFGKLRPACALCKTVAFEDPKV